MPVRIDLQKKEPISFWPSSPKSISRYILSQKEETVYQVLANLLPHPVGRIVQLFVIFSKKRMYIAGWDIL
jgi:hypothetical protein